MSNISSSYHMKGTARFDIHILMMVVKALIDSETDTVFSGF